MNRKLPVLKIRDENGNFIPINAIRGDKGKSAYEQAKEGGYNGTEEAFIAFLNGITATIDAQHYADLNNPHKVTKSQVGLGNVDNTADIDKPISAEQLEAFHSIEEGLARANSVILPHVANKNNPHEVTYSQVGAAPASHTSNTSNPHKVTASQVGLGNVNNTSDANKPVSTAQATAIADAKKAGTDAQSNLNSHTSNKSNPHGVTKAQVGLGNVSAEGYNVAIGLESQATSQGVAIGWGAKATGLNSIQIAYGTNTTPNSFQVGSTVLLDSNQKIPSERLPVTKGTYNGLTHSDTRTIQIGGTGGLLLITSANGMALVTSQGAICKKSTGMTTVSVSNARVSFSGGVLTIYNNSQGDGTIDGSGTYSYQVI